MVGYTTTFVPLCSKYISQTDHGCNLQDLLLCDLLVYFYPLVACRILYSAINACQQWGSFLLVSKSISSSLMTQRGAIFSSQASPSGGGGKPIVLPIVCDVYWGFPIGKYSIRCTSFFFLPLSFLIHNLFYFFKKECKLSLFILHTIPSFQSLLFSHSLYLCTHPPLSTPQRG